MSLLRLTRNSSTVECRGTWSAFRASQQLSRCLYRWIGRRKKALLVLQVARNYTAQTLNLATGKSLTQYDVIAVSAMEAIGVAPAIDVHNDISGELFPAASCTLLNNPTPSGLE